MSRLGRFTVDGELGRGAQAVVYRAHDERGVAVAVKVLAVDLRRDPTMHARFAREAEAVAALDHPAVVPVVEVGEADDGRPYLAMALVEGESLQALIDAGGGLEPAAAVSVLRRVAGALDAAHARGLVHRDVKPANILLDAAGTAYLTDFGLVRPLSGPALTRTGMWVGTMDYMAPEQIRATGVGPATDVYALAAVAYEALTGRPPFVRRNAADLLDAHLKDAPRPPSALRPGLEGADAVLGRGLAKEPRDRYASAGALVHALAGALGVA